MSDTFFMHHALELADEPERSTSPNPRVGALLVRDGEIVSQGMHKGPGLEHAEEMAIRLAGEDAAGTTLYCTLEPCSHSGHGKHRPPCAPLIVASGVSRVVIAQLDPNPRVRGRGTAIIEAAGIDVVVGPGADDALALNAGFNTWMSLGRPFVHIKSAQSLDGRTSATDGSSRWITDDTARAHAHLQRGRHDAVVVGIGTVLADDPILTVRHGPPRRPLAVVLDGAARLPTTSRLVRERAEETVVIARPDAPAARVSALREMGVRVFTAETTEPAEVLTILGGARLLSLYVEGGRRVIRSFLEAGLFDRVTSYIAPILIGGPHLGLDPRPASRMDDAIRLEDARADVVGHQAVITGYRPGWRSSIQDALRAQEACHVHGAR